MTKIQKNVLGENLENCTNNNCDRRREYLLAASQLLIKDLQYIQSVWSSEGQARLDLLNDKENGIKRILIGMGSLSYGELAGERMKLGLMLNDPEEEHDCFSDNTHNSHFFNVVGIRNIYLGKYKNISGKNIEGFSISDAVAKVDPKLDKKVKRTQGRPLAANLISVERAFMYVIVLCLSLIHI